jgi:hypothetical protein
MSPRDKDKNHLFDNIEDNQADYDGIENPDSLKEDSIIVKSTPTKFSHLLSKDDPSNPYTNSNLDADLLMTIGKNK